jgi:hypothetical protein
MSRVGRRRPESSSSDPASELTSFFSDADPISHESHEGTSGVQDDTIEVKANGASKRALQVESSAIESRKRRNTREVPHTREESCPRPRLIFKLKLTQEKMSHDSQRLHAVSANLVPATVTASQLRAGQIQQSQVSSDSTAYIDPSPTQERPESRYPPQPSMTDELDETVVLSPRYNHNHPPQSDRSASTSAAGTRIDTVEEVNEDRSHREQSPATVPDMAERPTLAAREAASQASEALRVSDLERIGCEARVKERETLPVAAPSQALDNNKRQPVVPYAIPTTAPMFHPITRTTPVPAQVTAQDTTSSTELLSAPSPTSMPPPLRSALEPADVPATAIPTGPLSTPSTTTGTASNVISMPSLANTAPTAAGTTLSNPAQPTTTQSPSAETAQLTNNIRMLLKMKRDSDANAQKVRLFSLEGVAKSSDLFAALRDEVEELLDAGEKTVRVDVKWLSDPPTAELMTDFIMTPMTAVGRDRSWDSLLEGLQDHYDETGEFVKVKLEATVLVRNGLDEEP